MLSFIQVLFFSEVFLKREGVPEAFQVESVRPFKSFYVFKLKGIHTLSQAAEFVRHDVWIPEKDLSPLKAGQYYLHQFTGFLVETKRGRKVGRVKDFLSVPDNNLLVVEWKGQEVLIPFVESICVSVDTDRRRVVIDPPAGLLELNEI